MRFFIILAALLVGFTGLANAQTTVNTNTNSKSDVTTNGQTIVIPSPLQLHSNSSHRSVMYSRCSWCSTNTNIRYSNGETVRDANCERLKLLKTLYDMGMKVLAVSTLFKIEEFMMQWRWQAHLSALGKIMTLQPTNGRINKIAPSFGDKRRCSKETS